MPPPCCWWWSPTTTTKLNITKTLVNVANDKLSFILHDVFTEEECKDFIAEAERQGFEEAMVNNGTNPTLDKDFRKGGRCVINNQKKANEIWSRIKFYIPKQWDGDKVKGLNPKLRVLKYENGDFFKAHTDHFHVEKDGSEQSYLTIQLYLNEGFKGGNTTFLTDEEDEENVAVVPRTGSVLVFQKEMMHEGSLLEDGVKYTLTSDVMYENTINPIPGVGGYPIPPCPKD